MARELGERLKGFDVVINTAGLPDATGTESDEMFGANALLPGFLARAAAYSGAERFIHVSSAVVQGSTMLDDSPATEGFSPYSLSKVLGEFGVSSSLPDRGRTAAVIYRPPSVHAPERRITQALARVAGSPLSAVAFPGTAGTPQALAENVGSAVAFLATYGASPPRIVHHPWEGLTTGQLLRLLGDGREPKMISPRLAGPLARLSARALQRSTKLRPHARRLEMLWFGQSQAPSWLSAAGWSPTHGTDRWLEIGRVLNDRS